MDQAKKLTGFTLIEEKFSEETGSMAYLYKHDKTGATLLHLQNDDSNKTFGVGFRTPPEDSTGVAHILEHSVLSGSEKFKTKEPFMDLVQSSLQTFLNAMTFADMTIYPVSSKNDQDFRNLVEVYLDAVFFPLVHERPLIFKQEGWHYELADETSDLIYNGVVFNEMRGAYSSPETYTQRQDMANLYPGSTYAHESGGDPWAIPDLKYEDFLHFHERFYHPSNALFFFYGDLDLEGLVQLLSDDYLSRFEKIDPKSEIEKGQPLQGQKLYEGTYNAEPGLEAEGDSYLTYAVPFGEATDNKSRFILGLLYKILLNSEAAPLRRAILEAGLAEDVDAVGQDIFYLTFGLSLKKARASDLDKFAELVEKVLREQVEQGLDRDLVLASLNAEEMQMRELGGAQRGVILFILSMYAYRYDLNPMDFLSYNQFLQEVREGIDQGLLESYIQERILDNPNLLLAIHRPEEGLYARFDQEARAKLEAKKRSLSPAEKERLIAETKELLTYQQTPDTPEAKATIPRLKLNELKPEPENIPEEEKTSCDTLFLLHPAKCSGLSYAQLSFPISYLSWEEISDLGFLSRLLGMVNAGDLDYSKLDVDIAKLSGGISFSPAYYTTPEGEVVRWFNIRYGTIGNRHAEILKLVQKILLESDFTEFKRVREVLAQIKLSIEQMFDFSSHTIGLSRAISHVSLQEKLSDTSDGLGFYFTLAEVLKDEAKLRELCTRLEALLAKIAQKSGLIVSLTADPDQVSDCQESFADFIAAIPSRELDTVALPFEAEPKREAFTTSTGINYVQIGQNLKTLGTEYEPAMTVLANVLSLDFLHNLIRAQGGAYGAGNPVQVSGNIGFYSYRDPNLKRSYEIYHQVPEYIRQLEINDQDLEGSIIGSINKFDPVITPNMINSLMFQRRFDGRDAAYLKRMLGELVQVKSRELKPLAEIYEKVLANESLCVIGDESKVREQAELFDRIEPLKR